MYNNIITYLDYPIEFIAISHGRDYVISVKGGSLAHVGAVSICIPGSNASVITAPGHKDDILALDLATILCSSLNATVAVTVGIHYDNLTKSQINDIIEIVTSLMDQFIEYLKTTT